MNETFECEECDAVFTGSRYAFTDAGWGVSFGDDRFVHQEAYYCTECAARVHHINPQRLGVYSLR
jgi:hypothetical protein